MGWMCFFNLCMCVCAQFCSFRTLLFADMMQLQAALACCLLMAGVISAQFFVQGPGLTFQGQPLTFQQAPLVDQSKRALAHRAVLVNSEAEAQLPPSLQNPFYKNPRIEAALAKESWFTPGEEQVREREAEKIPRQKIYSILKNAGFVKRRWKDHEHIIVTSLMTRTWTDYIISYRHLPRIFWLLIIM
jgi:hypothetical protein